MMSPIIKSWASADIGHAELETWQPETEVWQIPLEIEIGPEDGRGAEIFQVTVQSLAFTEAQLDQHAGIALGRTVVLREYSFEGLKNAVERVIAECRSTTWPEFARRLNWYMQWEFENYR